MPLTIDERRRIHEKLAEHLGEHEGRTLLNQLASDDDGRCITERMLRDELQQHRLAISRKCDAIAHRLQLAEMALYLAAWMLALATFVIGLVLTRQ